MDRLAFDIDRRDSGGSDNDHVLFGRGFEIFEQRRFARAGFSGNECALGGMFHEVKRGEEFFIKIQLAGVEIRVGQCFALRVRG